MIRRFAAAKKAFRLPRHAYRPGRYLFEIIKIPQDSVRDGIRSVYHTLWSLGTRKNWDDGIWVSMGFFLGWRFIVRLNRIETPFFCGRSKSWFNG